MFYGEIVKACNESGGWRDFIWIDLATFLCYIKIPTVKSLFVLVAIFKE